MAKKEKAGALTPEEIKELGLPEKLAKDWYYVLNALYCIAKESCNNDDDVVNGENEIIIGEWTIDAKFVNSSYITVQASKGGVEYLSVRYDNNLKVIASCVFSVILNEVI